jgi:hypothetical protein
MRFYIRAALGAAMLFITYLSFYVVFFIDSEQSVPYNAQKDGEKSANTFYQLNEMLEVERLQIYEDLVDLQFYMRSEFDQLKSKHNALKEDKQFDLFARNSIKRIK